jgi:hypothetical protein
VSSHFWGWDKLWNLVNTIAYTAHNAKPGLGGLTIEELDLQNEVDLPAATVEARLIYDNTPGIPTPPGILDYIGSALANNGFSATAATVSVVTPHGPAGIFS